MGHALKIPSVDFSDVAVDTVTFSENIPCTGISLNANSLSFETVGDTAILVATVTPSATTSVLTWTSSNPSVASVADGVVTIHGIGNATITATCGNHSASATISQTSIKPAGGTKILEGYYPSNGYGTVYVSTIEGQCTVGQDYDADDEDIHLLFGAASAAHIQAIRVPYGATKAKIKTSDDVAVTISYSLIADATEMVAVSGAGDFPAYVSTTTSVSSSTGLTCSYGQCVCFRMTNWATVSYVYFE